MSTLLLRLAGPLQAWGSSSKFSTRNTNREPTKSGVLGMIASAMGKGREEPIEYLNVLRFGIRVDQEGELQRDFHTAHHPNISKLSFISYRHYLSDALFIVGLEGDGGLLADIEYALRNPTYPLFLGRRSCPPTMPIVLGIRSASLCDALRDEPWMAAEWYRKIALPVVNLRTAYDAVKPDETAISVQDRPISYAQKHRIHGFRDVILSNVGPMHNDLSVNRLKRENGTEHDPVAEIKEFNKVG